MTSVSGAVRELGLPAVRGACAFDATYRYGFVGGHVTWVDTVIIAPPAAYQHVRSPVTTMPADISCAPPPPACGDPALDVADVMTALGDVDVQDALARSLGAGTIPLTAATSAPPTDRHSSYATAGAAS